MANHLQFFQSVVGPDHVISDDQKTTWAKDYTKAFTPSPLVIVLPATTDEAAKCVKYCYENKLAVVPSGGRTGLSGGAVAANQEVVISTSRMKKIFEINGVEKTMRCQAGVVTKEVQRAAREAELFFPVDFASSGSSQIGGNIATNAGGIKVIRWGLMRQWVLGLKVVTGTGQVLDMENACIKNNTGYDLKQLFIGAEGTLGLITECLIKLTTPPSNLLVSLFGVQSLENVTKLFDLTGKMKLNLTAYEYFSEFALKRVQEHTHLQSPFSQTFPFYALVEIEKATADDEKKLEDFVQAAMDAGLIDDGVLAQTSEQHTTFWALRENIAESLSVLTVAHKNDISIPLSNIAKFSRELDAVIALRYPGFEVVSFGHIGDGNLHVNYIKPEKMNKDEFFKHAHEADREMFNLVKKHGGSVSAEHGIGLTKKDFLGYTRSIEEIAIMRQIKKVFDPAGIMNPGKIFD
jgi:glycolate oxidase subunit GlcD